MPVCVYTRNKKKRTKIKCGLLVGYTLKELHKQGLLFILINFCRLLSFIDLHTRYLRTSAHLDGKYMKRFIEPHTKIATIISIYTSEYMHTTRCSSVVMPNQLNV